MTKPVNRRFEFGPFRLETAERLLLREGKQVSLTPKAFSTLLILVDNRGRLVEKDDLIKQVWPDAIVEEANLARNVWTLRKALGDGDDGHVYIETIPKVGYRFVAPVTERSTESDGIAVRDAAVAEVDAGAQVTPQPPSAQRFGQRRFGRAVLIGSALLVLMLVLLAQVWREPAPSARADTSATTLTDGRYEDNAASWSDSGHIYFSRFVTDSRVETWTMNADGTNQHRANERIAGLLTGRWSPNGKKVIFVKEGDPRTVYVADAGGDGEITLPFVPGNLDWSADGSKFVYQAKTETSTSAIFLYTLDTGKSTELTNQPSGDADPSFSDDGTQIAFTSWRDGNAEIYVMNADGSNVRRVTTHPAFDNYPVFSPDGTQLAFQSNRDEEHVEVYVQNLNDGTAPPKAHDVDQLHGNRAEMLVAGWNADARVFEPPRQGPDSGDRRGACSGPPAPGR